MFFDAISMPELIVILAIALLVFGPNKLPEMGRSLGQALREFKKSTSELTQEVTSAMRDEPQPAAPVRPAEIKPAEIKPAELPHSEMTNTHTP